MPPLLREYPKSPVPAVAGIVFDPEGRVLLVERGKEPAKGKWSFPGGAVILGETLEEAVKREILEETGIDVKVGPLIEASSRIIHDGNRCPKYHYILLDYLCVPCSLDIKAGSDADRVIWVPRDRVRELDVTEGLETVIQNGWEKARNFHY